MATEPARLVTRVDAALFRRLKIEAARSGQSIQQLVEQALRALLEARDGHA